MKKSDVHNNTKYLTKSIVSNFLLNNFIKKITASISVINFKSILDAGCGEGIILLNIEEQLQNKSCTGIDINENHIELARKNVTFCDFNYGSIYEIPFEANSFELVIANQILEHLEYPFKAIKELHRVSSKYVLISVPNEPLWSLLNMTRGKYLNNWGNTPAHLNKWSSKSIKKLLKNEFEIISVYKPIPWLIVLAKKK